MDINNKIKDYSDYFLEIKHKYPTLKNYTRFHLWPNKTVIFNKMHEKQKRIFLENKSITTINDSAYMILKRCTGTRTTEEIVIELKEKLNIKDEQLEVKVAKFISQSVDVNKNMILNNFAGEGIPIEYTGSREYYYPIHFTIELTDLCNLRCKHCYRIEDHEIMHNELTLDEIKSVIDQMYELGARTLEITGGEFTLHKNFMDVIKYAYKKMDLIGLLTNGTIISMDNLEELHEYSDKLFWNISLDSCYEEYHDNFRGKKGSYKKTCDTIKKLVEIGFIVRVAMSVTESNLDHISQTMDFVHNELKAKAFSFSPVLPIGNGKNTEGLLSKPEHYLKIHEIQEYSKKYGEFVYYPETSEMKKAYESTRNCGAGWKNIVISPTGNLRPCVMIDETMFNIGNIREKRLCELFKNKIIKEILNIEMPIESVCGSCFNLLFCKGCYFRGILTNINRLDQDFDYCSWAKRNKLEKYINKEYSNSCPNKLCSY